MATWDDARRYALALPDTFEEPVYRMAAVKVRTGKSKGTSIVWERPLTKSDMKAIGHAGPPGPLIAVRLPDQEMKDALLLRDTNVYFTIPHFEGYNAILIQLKHIKLRELQAIILESWLATAPEKTVQAFLMRKK